MALSFEDEIHGFLYHSVEQDQFFQEALAAPEGGHTVDAKEAIYALARAHAIHSKALLRIAQAIDELRAELI